MKNSQANTKPTPGALKDWHWKDVLVALNKKGYSLRQIGMAEGYPDGNALGLAARRPFPKAEGIVAKYLGVEPQTIWPSRYTADGVPNRRRGPRPMWPAGDNKNRAIETRSNPQARKAG